MMNRKRVGELALIACTLIWGATFAIVKNSLSDASPLMFVFTRFTFTSLLVLPFVYKKLFQMNRQTLLGGVILGVVNASAFATQTIGLKYTSATKSGFITGSLVLFAPFFQYMLEKKKPGKGTISGIVLVVIGLILLSSKGDNIFNILDELGGSFNVGDALTLLCAILYGFYIVYLDIVSKKSDLGTLVFLQISVTAAFTLLMIGLLTPIGLEMPRINFSQSLIFGLLYTSILATMVTTYTMTRFQKEVTPAKAGIIYSFEPIFAAFIAYMMLGETISIMGYLGCLFIFMGLVASEVIDKMD